LCHTNRTTEERMQYQKNIGKTEERKPHKVFTLRKGNKFYIVKAYDIAFFYSENKIVFAVDKHGQKYFTDSTLTSIEQMVDEEMFFRANRKFIVNLFYIKYFQPADRVKLKVYLDTENKINEITVSQLTASSFKKWINTN
jgi:DNA-binding LytR/AlgR family response regulator